MNRIFSLLLLILLFNCQVPENRETLEIEEIDQPTAVRGVWLTNVASDVLTSREKIAEAVTLLDTLGFNTIFVVTWNKAATMYRSQVMDSLFNQPIDPVYGERDPLQEIIEEAHALDIKVFAWFEFGFSSGFKSNGGLIPDKFPQWASRDQQGNIAEKNGFEWMNALHPEVQEFMTALVLELVENYEVDGIQGDDRLPAMPSNAGYSDFTKNLYADEHGGNYPPEYAKDYEWIQWRAQKLSEYGKALYAKVKAADPNCIVSMAPSIYPWSEENYLQDWPVWVNQGFVDLIIPQLYRYDIESYKKLLQEITHWQIDQKNFHKFYPGVLLQVNDYNPDPEFLRQMINANREYGIHGEVFFFYEGVKKFPELFKDIYQDNIEFPTLTSQENETE